MPVWNYYIDHRLRSMYGTKVSKKAVKSIWNGFTKILRQNKNKDRDSFLRTCYVKNIYYDRLQIITIDFLYIIKTETYRKLIIKHINWLCWMNVQVSTQN